MHRTTSLAVAAIAAAAVAAAPTLVSSPSPDFQPSAIFEPEGTYEDDMDCLQLTGPGAAQPTGPLGGDTVDLHVRLVMDLQDSRALDAVEDNPETEDVDERQAAIDAFGEQLVTDHLASGAQAYEEIGITLNYGSFDVLEAPDLREGERSPTMEGSQAIQLGKNQYGGERPEGTDLVYVLSDRDLQSGGSSSLAGLADCIGGVASPQHAFATGEFDPDAEFSIGVPFYREYTAKVAAHEVGHLMGAHHHYQACGHYAATNFADGNGAGACTLMTNFVDFVTFPFSPTNQIVTRGHAEDFAAGNDGAESHAGHDH